MTEPTLNVVRANGTLGRPSASVQAQFGLAHGWLRRGREDRAAIHFERVLTLDPDLEDPYLELCRIHLRQCRYRDVIRVCEKGLQHFPDQAELHKRHIASLNALYGHATTLERYGLERLDDLPTTIESGAILACLVVRDERQRLPWFFRECRELGVDRFFVVDNGSTDGTVEFLLEQGDVHLWSTSMAFNRGNYGSAWFEVLMSHYGLGHWLVMLDADEVLRIPVSEPNPLHAFCNELERHGKSAVAGPMIDMYSDRPLNETTYRPETDFLSTCQYFDRQVFHDRFANAGPFENQTFYFGGMRKRVFGDRSEYLISKVPLLKYRSDLILAGGQHWTSYRSEQIAHDSAAVLHFKYFASFADYADQEAQRKTHSMDGQQYKTYADTLRSDPSICFFDPAHSIKFDGIEQLARMGLVDTAWRDESTEPPCIEPVPLDAPRPRWSVVVTAFSRSTSLARALSSALDQLPDDAEVLVICDYHSDETSASIRDVVESVDPESIARLTILPSRVGHPEIFNESIRRATGQFIHVLHDDDWVLPGFYDALERGLALDGVTAAFARHAVANGEMQLIWNSAMERESSGVLHDWSERLALSCRVQFSSIAVRRDAYEAVGGFRAGIGSAFDWEMWQRLAAAGNTWFTPELLAVTGRDGSAESDQLAQNGKQITDAVSALEYGQRLQPRSRSAHLLARARRQIALEGVSNALEDIRCGRYDQALLNLRATLDSSATPRVIEAIKQVLAEVDTDNTAEDEVRV